MEGKQLEQRKMKRSSTWKRIKSRSKFISKTEEEYQQGKEKESE